MNYLEKIYIKHRMQFYTQMLQKTENRNRYKFTYLLSIMAINLEYTD